MIDLDRTRDCGDKPDKSDSGQLDFSVYNENISFFQMYELMLLVIRLSSEVKLQTVRLSPLTQRAVRRLAVSMLTSVNNSDIVAVVSSLCS